MNASLKLRGSEGQCSEDTEKKGCSSSSVLFVCWDWDISKREAYLVLNWLAAYQVPSSNGSTKMNKVNWDAGFTSVPNMHNAEKLKKSFPFVRLVISKFLLSSVANILKMLNTQEDRPILQGT